MLRCLVISLKAYRPFLQPCLWILVLPVVVQADQGWKVMGLEGGDGQVRLTCPPHGEFRSDRDLFLITHGMNGTCEGDRFHLLGESIASAHSGANVVLVDWSKTSCSSWFPPVVARHIDSVADEAHEKLCELGIDPERATLIGESFGNYVNARIATNFGKVDHLIAMNPASELGGYPIPDLRRCSRVSWSFHTYSGFDTLRRIADRCIYIQTAETANELDRHTSGIRRLTSVTARGERLVPPPASGPCRDQDRFDAMWTLDGNFVPTSQRRIHPALESPTDQAVPSL